MTEPTLTACPVCGAGVDDLTVTGKSIDGVPIWWITCDKCGHRCYGGTMEETVERWSEVKPT
jgi:uncharacterized protein YlaI